MRRAVEPLVGQVFRVILSGTGGRCEFRAVSVSQVSVDILTSALYSGGELSPRSVRHFCEVSRLRVEVPLSAGIVPALTDWWTGITDASKRLERRGIDVYLLDAEGQEVRGWRFLQGWICKWGLSSLSQAVESTKLTLYYEFVHEGMEELHLKAKALRRDASPSGASDRELEKYAEIGAREMHVHRHKAVTNSPKAREAWERAFASAPANLSIAQVRAKYIKETSEIGAVVTEQLSMGWKKNEIANQSNLLRRMIGVKYKAVTPEPEKSVILRRNWGLYGDPLGPKTSVLRSEGNTWKKIIEKSSRSNRSISESFGGKR